MRHVIFDFFGTLVTYREGIEGNPIERARMELATHGVELPADELAGRLSACFAVLEDAAGQTLREYSMNDAIEMLYGELGVATSRHRVDRFVEAYLNDWTDSVRSLPRLGDWLAALPVRKSVLSNTHHEPMVVGLMDRLGIGDAFDRLTTSISHGFRKPHPSIYEAHLEALGIAANEAVFVGDNVECDFVAPRRVGMEAYLVSARPVSGVAERYRLAHLYQLIERLT